MRLSFLRQLCIAASAFALFASNVRAADINVSNLTAAQASWSMLNNSTIKQASSFTTDAFTGTISLDSISLRLSSFGVYDLSTLSVGIYTNNAGTPSGSQVGTNYTASGAGSTGDFTFNNYGVNRAELNPSSTYWLVVRNTVSTFVFWGYNNTATTPFTGLNASINIGSVENSTGIGWSVFPNQTLLFSLVGVPEPSTYAMGAVGVMTLAGLARRRKKTA